MAFEKDEKALKQCKKGYKMEGYHQVLFKIKVNSIEDDGDV